MLERIIKPLRQMSPGGVAGLLACLGFIGVAGFFAVARVINTVPSQCASCHPALTAMWQRSQGHPAQQVTCHQCHAGHAQLPASLNLGGFLRDQLIPEKYLAADQRIEARCRQCHGEIAATGTGPALIAAKETLKQVANLIAPEAAGSQQVHVPGAVLVDGGEDADGRQLLLATLRYLREAEWRRAAQRVAPAAADGLLPALEDVRQPLEFSSQSLGWARVKAAKVAAGVSSRVGKRLNQFKAGMGHVRRGVEELQQVLPGPDAETAPALDPAQVDVARALLENMSRGLKSAGRARDALLRELGAVDDAVLDPNRLARLLRALPRGLKKNDLAAVHKALDAAAQALRADLYDADRIDARTEQRALELTAGLQAKLDGLRSALRTVLGDLPPPRPVAADGELRLQVAQIASHPGSKPGTAVAPLPGVGVDPEALAAAALTALRSLQVSLQAAPNLGWSDFSLRDGHVAALEEGFVALQQAFAAVDEEQPTVRAVRNGVETVVAALAAGLAEDGVGLRFAATATADAADAVLAVDLQAAVTLALDALFDLEQQQELRHVIKVNHRVHFLLREDLAGHPVQVGCLDCHRNIAHDKAQLETNRPTMASCFVGNCHRKDRNKDNCRRCHFQHLADDTPEIM